MDIWVCAFGCSSGRGQKRVMCSWFSVLPHPHPLIPAVSDFNPMHVQLNGGIRWQIRISPLRVSSFCRHPLCLVDKLCFMNGDTPRKARWTLPLPYICLYVGDTNRVQKNQLWLPRDTIMLLLEPQRRWPSAWGRCICPTFALLPKG